MGDKVIFTGTNNHNHAYDFLFSTGTNTFAFANYDNTTFDEKAGTAYLLKTSNASGVIPTQIEYMDSYGIINNTVNNTTRL